MELVIVMFIIWLIMSIIVIGSASILTLLNKGRQGVVILGIWIIITFILFMINLIIPIKYTRNQS
jgi:regulator of protease activity HflC (stomatin/prohibitin superfamily)